MGRSIINAPAISPSSTRGGSLGHANEQADAYADRLLKLIPAEVIALYMAMDGVLTDNGDNTITMSIITLGIGIFATWFYLQVFQKVKNVTQVAVSVVAFAIWAVNIGHGFEEAGLIKPSYAALGLLVFTFFAPKIPMGETPKPLPPL